MAEFLQRVSERGPKIKNIDGYIVRAARGILKERTVDGEACQHGAHGYTGDDGGEWHHDGCYDEEHYDDGAAAAQNSGWQDTADGEEYWHEAYNSEVGNDGWHDDGAAVGDGQGWHDEVAGDDGWTDDRAGEEDDGGHDEATGEVGGDQ